jgi:hypothetical protein
MTLNIVETTTVRNLGEKTKVTQKRSVLTDDWGFFGVGSTELTVSDNRYEALIEANKLISIRTNYHQLETRQVDLRKPGDFFHHEFCQNIGPDNLPTGSITHKIHVRKVS